MIKWRFVLAWWILLSVLSGVFLFGVVLILSHEMIRFVFSLGMGALVVFWLMGWAVDYLQSYRGSR